jgi:hypothetical protein
MKNNQKQHIIVFQQHGSGEAKVKGIKKYGKDRFSLELISVDTPLPSVIDDARDYLPENIQGDLVLDFLKHPDLSHDLAEICRQHSIPVVASGKKIRMKHVFTPPT